MKHKWWLFKSGWGNARDAIALWKSILNHRANRVVHNPESMKTIDKSDVVKAFDEMIEARRPKVSKEDRIREMLKEAAEGLEQIQQDEPKTKLEVRIIKLT